MKLLIKTEEDKSVNAIFEGKLIDAAEAIAEIMIRNDDLKMVFQTAIQIYDYYQENK